MKLKNVENWGRAKAKQRYAEGGGVDDDSPRSGPDSYTTPAGPYGTPDPNAGPDSYSTPAGNLNPRPSKRRED